ncbi:MAG TPA: hypothetical protein VK524_06910 [Polyangiaceae bacterium]|nr:hypothetical protein [Polyangiaceae bacterium]
MPYIPAEHRAELDALIEPLAKKLAARAALSEGDAAYAGLLNYAITQLALTVLRERFGTLRYWMIATTSGVFHNVADEFYRRVAHVYEDEQREKQGDLPLFAELLKRGKAGP